MAWISTESVSVPSISKMTAVIGYTLAPRCELSHNCYRKKFEWIRPLSFDWMTSWVLLRPSAAPWKVQWRLPACGSSLCACRSAYDASPSVLPGRPSCCTCGRLISSWDLNSFSCWNSCFWNLISLLPYRSPLEGETYVQTQGEAD